MKTFSCGCAFETDSDGKIIFNPNIELIPKDCSLTWDMICNGHTKGIFQLERQGNNAKKVQPRSIEELSDLISIIRPGCVESFIKGKSLTQHYIDRKHGREDVEYLHPALEPILSRTQGILVYQEQAMSIAKELAGFSLQEADTLRKAIGKKNVELMAKIKTEFINKAVDHGILNREEAIEIFSWIEASQRYSFNKCLSPNTIVITENGEKLLSEIHIGDMVLAPKTQNENEFVEVLDIIDTGDKDVYEITLDNGNTLQCTLDHKILCVDGKKYTLRQILEEDLEIWCID